MKDARKEFEISDLRFAIVFLRAPSVVNRLAPYAHLTLTRDSHQMLQLKARAITLRARIARLWRCVREKATNLLPERRPTTEQEAAHLLLGRAGEERALEFLARQGFRLVAANVQLPVGRTRRGAEVKAEVDIIAYDGATLCFVEVKTRRTDDFARPEANVDLRKQRQISRAARRYRRLLNITADPFRYDVVSVLLPDPDAPAEIEHLRAYWTDAKFRKRRWMARDDYGVR